MLRQLSRRLKALHRDERGADMLEYILIIAAVALPLLAVVIWLWKDIKEWMLARWESIKGGADAGTP